MGKILLSLILSADGLGIGFSLGVRGTRITRRGYMVLFLVSLIMLETSVLVGKTLLNILPGKMTVHLGAWILIFVGLALTAQRIHELMHNQNKESSRRWDMDDSGSIELLEAVFLAAALSADAFGAGIGIGSICQDAKIIPLIMSAFQIAFLNGGCIAGKRIKKEANGLPFIDLLSGLILVLMGIAGLKTGGIFI